jgi:hypothetical protein
MLLSYILTLLIMFFITIFIHFNPVVVKRSQNRIIISENHLEKHDQQGSCNTYTALLNFFFFIFKFKAYVTTTGLEIRKNAYEKHYQLGGFNWEAYTTRPIYKFQNINNFIAYVTTIGLEIHENKFEKHVHKGQYSWETYVTRLKYIYFFIKFQCLCYRHRVRDMKKCI